MIALREENIKTYLNENWEFLEKNFMYAVEKKEKAIPKLPSREWS